MSAAIATRKAKTPPKADLYWLKGIGYIDNLQAGYTSSNKCKISNDLNILDTIQIFAYKLVFKIIFNNFSTKARVFLVFENF